MALSAKSVTKAVLAVVGTLVSLLLIATVFVEIRLSGPGPLWQPRFHLGHFFAELPKHLPWLLAFMALTASMVPARALQWQTALFHPVPFRERYHFVAIGAFVHNALPGKFGDLFRAFLMARTRKLPLVQTLGSVAVCKLLEFAALMLLVGLSFLGPFAKTMGRFSSGVRIAVVACLGLVGLVVFLARYAASLAAALRRRRRWAKAEAFLVNLSVGLGTARSASGMARALLLSIPPVLAPAIGYGLGLHAVGIEGGLFAGAVVLGAIALGQVVPGFPAGTGIYYFATSWVARELGASATDAAAFAALTHLGTLTTQIFVGAVSLWTRKLKWKDLKRGADDAAQAAKEMSPSTPEALRA
ncbi:MAG: lysylphosphatidylglycerol synthase transmembrane domain-containing protein [Myxococcota bacterium]